MSASVVSVPLHGDDGVLNGTSNSCFQKHRRLDVHHKAALSLNNTALSLLTRGFCNEAIALLIDARKVLSRSFTVASHLMTTATNGSASPGSSDDDREAMRASDKVVHCMQQRAENLAATLGTNGLDRMSAPTCHTRRRNGQPMKHWQLLHVVSSQDHPAEQVHTILTQHHPAIALRFVFPMTIDPMDHETLSLYNVNERHDSLRFHVNVVEYNLAISLQCRVATGSATPKATSINYAGVHHMMRSIGARLFDFEYHHSVHLQRQRSPNGLFSIPPSCLSNQIVLLQMILHHALMYAVVQLGLPEEFQAYRHALQRYLQSVQSQAGTVLADLNGQPAAAA